MGKRKKKNKQHEVDLLECQPAKEIFILTSKEDRVGENILIMSDFGEMAIKQYTNELFPVVESNIVVNDAMVEIGSINNAVRLFNAFTSPEFDLVADFASLPSDIYERYKKGEIILGESKQVEGNLRAALIDVKTKKIVKPVTLKKIANTTDISNIMHDISMQAQLRQISEQLSFIQAEQSYLIELTRNNMILNPFIQARNYILNAQNACSYEEQVGYLEKADAKMNEAIGGVYTDISTIIGALAKEEMKPFYKRISRTKNINIQMERLLADMQVLSKYAGLDMLILHYLGKSKEQETLMEVYMGKIRTFFEKGIVSPNKSLALLIHENTRYNEKNMDYWYNLEKTMKPMLSIDMGSGREKDLYMLVAEEEE